MAPSDAETLIGLLSDIERTMGRSRTQPPIDFDALLDRKPRIDPGQLGAYSFPKPKQGPSLLSRAFDLISRPLYMVAEPLRLAAEPGSDSPTDYLTAFGKGFMGKKKTRGVDVLLALDQRLNNNTPEESAEKWKSANPALKIMASLGLDVGLDPLTYLNPFSWGSKLKAPVVKPAEFQGVTKPSMADVAPEFRSGASPVQQSIEARAAGVKMPSLSELATNRPIDFSRPMDGQSLKLPDGRVIPLTPTRSSVPRFTERNIERDIIGPLREANYANAGVPGPEWFRQNVERIPTPDELLRQDIPATFRGALPPVNASQTLPRVDFDIPRAVRDPESLGVPPTQAAAAPRNLVSLGDEAIPPSTANDNFYGGIAAARAGYSDLASARKSGADQALRRDARIASNEAGERMARGFQSYRMSREGGMPFPEAMRIVNSMADGAIPAQVAASASSTVARELPKLSTRAGSEAIVANLADSLIDDITKGGKVRPNGVKYRDEFGVREQANLYNTAESRLIKSGTMRKEQAQREAYNVLRHAEDRLIQAGYRPLYRQGAGAPPQSLSLADLIDELGGPQALRGEHLTQVMNAFKSGNLTKIKSPEIAAAVTRLIEKSAQEAMPHVRAAGELTHRVLRQIEDVIPPGRIKQFQDSLKPQLIRSMKAADAPVSATSAAAKLLEDVKKASRPAREKITPEAKKQMQLSIERGTFGPKSAIVMESQTRNLEKALELQFAKLGEQVTVEPLTAWGTFISRFATHYGAKDVRPYFTSEIQKGIWQTNEKALYLGQIIRQYSKAERMEAWRAVQGFGPATTQRGQQLANDLDAIMHQLVNPQGVNSVAMSSVILQKDLNRALARLGESFRFTRKKNVTDSMGRTHDFSKGTDWLDSWKIAEVKDPAEFILKLDTALEQVVHRYTFFDEAAARWGSRKFGGEYRYKTSVDRLNGFYFPESIAKQLEKTAASIDEIYAPGSAFGRQFDNIMGALKSGMTIYNLSHHIRNAIGDVYNSWMAGVNGVRPYYQAQRVLGSQRHRYKGDFAGLAAISDDNALRRALTRPGDSVARNKSGVDFTAEQIYLGAGSNGLLQTAHAVDDIVGKQVTPLVLGGRVQKVARGASEWRDHEMRLAHFIDIINKSKGANKEEIFRKAAQEVRKWHPDGLDLTAFEKKYMRRIFPFYSWTRKAIPLMIESAIKNPGKTMLYPKTMLALQEGAGIESEGVGNPFPSDQLFPEWIRNKGIGPIASAGEGPFGFLTGMSATSGMGPDYTIFNPSNPFIDLMAQFGGQGRPQDPLRGAASMLNPFLKVPYEFTAGRELQTDQPIAGREADYFTKQIPIASVISRLTNYNITGQPTSKGEKEGPGNEQAFWNWLLALGLTGTGPLQTGAKIEQETKGR